MKCLVCHNEMQQRDHTNYKLANIFDSTYYCPNIIKSENFTDKTHYAINDKGLSRLKVGDFYFCVVYKENKTEISMPDIIVNEFIYYDKLFT